eukprot:TRINITY_DN1009_c0_g1_i2.p1 TRINITY_DN1009_c0_g1~~TRINITY_DN1009_c0_g1_i2.p1  ORF type:complete len:115 (-),score=34.79 TRINITY_DN1009_c0_g1_i2:118-462(-)
MRKTVQENIRDAFDLRRYAPVNSAEQRRAIDFGYKNLNFLLKCNTMPPNIVATLSDRHLEETFEEHNVKNKNNQKAQNNNNSNNSTNTNTNQQTTPTTQKGEPGKQVFEAVEFD